MNITTNVDTSLDCFQKIPKNVKKWEKHSDAEHSPNPPAYNYVDDFRTYFERIKIKNNIMTVKNFEEFTLNEKVHEWGTMDLCIYDAETGISYPVSEITYSKYNQKDLYSFLDITEVNGKQDIIKNADKVLPCTIYVMPNDEVEARTVDGKVALVLYDDGVEIRKNEMYRHPLFLLTDKTPGGPDSGQSRPTGKPTGR